MLLGWRSSKKSIVPPDSWESEMIVVKINTGGAASKHSFGDDIEWGEFELKVAEVTGIAQKHLEILNGFPPRLVQCSDPTTRILALGIQSGSIITVRVNPEKIGSTTTLSPECEALRAPLMEMGFAEEVISKVLAEYGVTDLGLAVECCASVVHHAPTVPSEPVVELVRKIIPADNSCLFNAIGYLIDGETQPMKYRQIVADTIAAQPDVYTQDFLDKSPSEYISWITSADKWGGEIELSILAIALHTEILVVDIRSSTILPYGTGSHASQRIFLLYDGVHYDALVLRTTQGKAQVREDRQFSVEDESIERRALILAKDLQQQKKFVNISSGQLLCKVCMQVLEGQKQAVEHAKATGHQNFELAS